ncbi:hypothetical protein [Kitasatospora sp. NPDC056731]|uniref:hypothetical protein n=1 Tax=Kitasatospora sp. NPDC056731 TaxID=3155422 RepID=UPI00343C5BFB
MYKSDNPGRFEISRDARDVYVRFVATGEPIREEDGGARSELLNLGLLRDDPVNGVTAVDPSYVGAQWEASFHTWAAGMLTEAAAIPDVLRDFRDAFDNRATDARAGVMELLRGSAAINARLGQVLAGCAQELLVCQPGGERRREILAETKDRDLGVLRRGVIMRTLYHANARSGSAAHEWVREMTAAGAEIRTLSEPFQRMIVIDRQIAVIPGDTILATSKDALAYIVHDRGVAGFLAEIFERDWARAETWAGETSHGKLTDRHEHILRELAQERDYEAIGKQLGVSKRTVALLVAEIKEIYGVETLFGLACAWRDEQSSRL